MLTAHANTPIDEFIAQLRTYVIALGLSTQVVDCVDRLADADDMEGVHAEELRDAEETAVREGRNSMKDEILAAVNCWLENQPNYDLIAAPCEALIAEIEKVEV